MIKYICAIIYFICCNLLAIGVASAGAPAASHDAARPFSFSNNFDVTPAGEEVYYPITAPFCQIYTSRFNIWRMGTEIIKFSTFKLGPCSSESFSKLSIASVIAQLKTIGHTGHAYKNGPSYFTMDSNLSPLNREYVYIGPLKFFAQSITNISLFRILFDPVLLQEGIPLSYFRPFMAHEDVYYIWDKGTTIFSLIPADKKGFYVMTSYSKMVDPAIDKSNIAEKIGQLSLPQGWSFEARVLDKPLIVRTKPGNNFAHKIIFDQLQNFYHHVE